VHGNDRAVFDAPVPEIRSIAYPYASTCSAMLEAAWAIEDAVPTD
jgi:hypothetical protein